MQDKPPPQTNDKADIFNKDYTEPTYTDSPTRKTSSDVTEIIYPLRHRSLRFEVLEPPHKSLNEKSVNDINNL